MIGVEPNAANWLLLGVIVAVVFGIICYLTVMMMDRHSQENDE